MILKRLGAIALAVILIGGAWLVRDRVIDDDGGSGNDDPPRAGREIVCVEDLRDACDALATNSISTFGSRTRRQHSTHSPRSRTRPRRRSGSRWSRSRRWSTTSVQVRTPRATGSDQTAIASSPVDARRARRSGRRVDDRVQTIRSIGPVSVTLPVARGRRSAATSRGGMSDRRSPRSTARSDCSVSPTRCRATSGRARSRSTIQASSRGRGRLAKRRPGQLR